MKRHLNIRLGDYLIRVQFDINKSIYETTKSINELILKINESYLEKNNLNDLSDQTYLDKVSKALGTKRIPRFLLRDGYRLRRQIQNNKELFLSMEDENEMEYNDHYSDEENDYSFDQVVQEENIKEEQHSIKYISKEIENKQKIPFDRELSEIYLMLFFLSLKEVENEEVYSAINNNLIELINYFKIKSDISYNEFKEKYIDLNEKDLTSEIVEMEFSEINKSEYLCKYIIASYYVLINNILRAQNDIIYSTFIHKILIIDEISNILLKEFHI